MKTLQDEEAWHFLANCAAQERMFDENQRLTAKKTESQQENCVKACGITLHFRHQCLTPKSLEKLIQLAHHVDLAVHMQHLFSGQLVNWSEKKPALHTALRAANNHPPLWVEEVNVIEHVQKAKQQIHRISEDLRSKQWRGFHGKTITDIVNVGIGGSDLGPKFCLHALSEYAHPELRFHFISNADPISLSNQLRQLNPDTTLFIVASKSFTTQETLINTEAILKWLESYRIAKHVIAVTANPAAAHAFGIQTILPIWSWVGGRYSACSAINLITAISIGYDHFEEMLQGARAMDEHFLQTPYAHNLPVLLALIGIWNINFKHINNLLILTYADRLSYFTSFIQQLDMESNGKSVDKQGKRIQHATAPLVWGGCGSQAQHSYYQLLSQGTHNFTADFITIASDENKILNGFCRAKMLALSQGIQETDNLAQRIDGNRRFNHISLETCTPKHIGALIALYEHKIFTQSVVWNINPFDQPGVDSSKQLQKNCIHENATD